MGTELLYQNDSYLRVFDAVIVEVTNEGVVLDRTAFHPTTGGVANDTGWLYIGLNKYEVIDVKIDKESGKVVHVLNTLEGVKPGLNVRGELNWDRRYKLMRLHTAAHILSAILYNDYGALVTGGSVEPDKAKEDYDIKEAKPEEAFAKAISKANEIVKKGIEVKIYWLSREEALKIPGIVKLASRMPPAIETLRIVEIPGVDIQADGGPHVKNTSEIGEITLLKVENKGKNRKRVYYTVKP
ncbi:MAG: alanyl-tRNA editing protein AlaX [Zestosphaera tikiterensis]|uniref:Alanyl-tRNA editing protein AlaX n=1 Tax=Zestosphaera tikiterensis TaxID=1973259 RepID=A0A2R7Y492_9CREN|nr:MAG: alanyl-tRNA editing protein AlaX [Zestosphaera tikiterensis]